MKQYVVWVRNNSLLPKYIIDIENEWERVSEWDDEREAKIQAEKLSRNGMYQTKITEESQNGI